MSWRLKTSYRTLFKMKTKTPLSNDEGANQARLATVLGFDTLQRLQLLNQRTVWSQNCRVARVEDWEVGRWEGLTTIDPRFRFWVWGVADLGQPGTGSAIPMGRLKVEN
jgi:hypothetical protein